MNETKVRDAVRITDELIDHARMSRLPEGDGLRLWQTVFEALVREPFAAQREPLPIERLLSAVGGVGALSNLRNNSLTALLLKEFDVEWDNKPSDGPA
jgi:hypothetical protein